MVARTSKGMLIGMDENADRSQEKSARKALALAKATNETGNIAMLIQIGNIQSKVP